MEIGLAGQIVIYGVFLLAFVGVPMFFAICLLSIWLPIRTALLIGYFAGAIPAIFVFGIFFEFLVVTAILCATYMISVFIGGSILRLARHSD
ncbi:hypothetical protein [Salinarimonas soli]|uniref:DUF2651 domain-containing protein n=1 Tax=Salinarimonas soli TaxID=1638099 RepID=A0A5B2VB03_9HYPH|nr:hypothetical protein [Salinarimonas soli]KAA2235572.1 hypothetical protein F0L46_18905 [Salinarimonas soli]